MSALTVAIRGKADVPIALDVLTSQHFRQLRTLRTARVVRIANNLLRALGDQFVEPVDHLGIAAPLIDEATPALVTRNAQHIDLPDEISEYDCAVAGHNDKHRTAGNPEKHFRAFNARQEPVTYCAELPRLVV